MADSHKHLGVVIGGDGNRLHGFDAELYLRMNAKRDRDWEYRVLSWVEIVTEKPLADLNDVWISLKSGVVLCRLVNKISPKYIPKIATNRLLPLVEMANIQLFLDACWHLGVPSDRIFLTTDLYKRKNLNAVFLCIAALAARAPRLGWTGPIIEGDVESERAGKLQKQKEENGGKPLEKVPEAKKWAPVQTAPRKVHIDDLQLPPEERDLANLQLKVAEQTEEIRSLKALLVNKDTELSSLRASVQSQRRALRDANRRLKHGEKSRKLSGVSEEEKEALANVILARSEKREQERLLRESIENTEKGRNSCGIENRTFFAGKDDRKANRGGKKGQKEREIAWYKDVLKLCVTANSDPAQQQEKEKLLTAARERVKACLSEAEHAKLLEDIGMPSETDRQSMVITGPIPLQPNANHSSAASSSDPSVRPSISPSSPSLLPVSSTSQFKRASSFSLNPRNSLLQGMSTRELDAAVVLKSLFSVPFKPSSRASINFPKVTGSVKEASDTIPKGTIPLGPLCRVQERFGQGDALGFELFKSIEGKKEEELLGLFDASSSEERESWTMAIREVLSYNCPVTPTQAQLLMASFSSDPGRRAFAQALSRLWQRLEIRQAKWEGRASAGAVLGCRSSAVFNSSFTRVQVRVAAGSLRWRPGKGNTAGLEEILSISRGKGAARQWEKHIFITLKGGRVVELQAMTAFECTEWVDGLRAAVYGAKHPSKAFPLLLDKPQFDIMLEVFDRLVWQTPTEGEQADYYTMHVLFSAAPRVGCVDGRSLLAVISPFAASLPITHWEEDCLRYLAGRLSVARERELESDTAVNNDSEKSWLTATLIKFLEQLCLVGVTPDTGRELVKGLQEDLDFDSEESVKTLEEFFEDWESNIGQGNSLVRRLANGTKALSAEQMIMHSMSGN